MSSFRKRPRGRTRAERDAATNSTRPAQTQAVTTTATSAQATDRIVADAAMLAAQIRGQLAADPANGAVFLQIGGQPSATASDEVAREHQGRLIPAAASLIMASEIIAAQEGRQVALHWPARVDGEVGWAVSYAGAVR